MRSAHTVFQCGNSSCVTSFNGVGDQRKPFFKHCTQRTHSFESAADQQLLPFGMYCISPQNTFAKQLGNSKPGLHLTDAGRSNCQQCHPILYFIWISKLNLQHIINSYLFVAQTILATCVCFFIGVLPRPNNQNVGVGLCRNT